MRTSLGEAMCVLRILLSRPRQPGRQARTSSFWAQSKSPHAHDQGPWAHKLVTPGCCSQVARPPLSRAPGAAAGPAAEARAKLHDAAARAAKSANEPLVPTGGG